MGHEAALPSHRTTAPRRRVAAHSEALLRALLVGCAKALVDDMGPSLRLVDLADDADADRLGSSCLHASLPVTARPARSLAWLGVVSSAHDALAPRRLRRAASSVDADGLAVLALMRTAPAPGPAALDERARRAGWCALQYWSDASARYVVLVLQRVAH